jgi:hypothetical protein
MGLNNRYEFVLLFDVKEETPMATPMPETYRE